MNYTYISSRQNATVQSISKLSDKKGRNAAGMFIAEGRKLCREATGRCSVIYALLHEDKKDDAALCELCEKSGGEIIVLSAGAYAKISADASPDGIIFVCGIPDNNESIAAEERVLILDCLRDPGNVGTVIRSAAAFGCDRLVLCNCADIYNPKTVRAAMGAIFKMKFTVCSDLEGIMDGIRSSGRRLLASALENNALKLGEAPLRKSDCIVIGNEGHGVSENVIEKCDGVIFIPMTDKTESLNAATAAAVLLWEQSKAE